MTIGIAWVGTRSDGRRYLYIASDSRTRGAMVLDCCPKIMALPRSDSAICFAGDTAATYPLMMQLANAVAAHQPSQNRSLDICTLKDHLLRVFSDMIARIQDGPTLFEAGDAQFIFGGYSWKRKDFEVWTIRYSNKSKRFIGWRAKSFHPLLPKAAFIGDHAKETRAELAALLETKRRAGVTDLRKVGSLEPLRIMSKMLRSSNRGDSIGGPPQLIRITEHMNTRIVCLKWPDDEHVTLLGRELFDYENVDYWILNPETLESSRPRSYGHRG